MANVLRLVANSGPAVIAAVHQPSAKVLRTFDRLLLLQEGEVAYSGRVDAVVPYLQSLGYERRPHENPADFVVQALFDVPVNGRQEGGDARAAAAKGGGGRRKGRGHKLVKAWRSRELESRKDAALEYDSDDYDDMHGYAITHPTSCCRQLCVLLRRSTATTLREPGQFGVMFSAHVLVALLLGSVYFGRGGQNPSQQNAQDMQACIYLLGLAMLMVPCTLTVSFFPAEKKTFQRE